MLFDYLFAYQDFTFCFYIFQKTIAYQNVIYGPSSIHIGFLWIGQSDPALRTALLVHCNLLKWAMSPWLLTPGLDPHNLVHNNMVKSV